MMFISVLDLFKIGIGPSSSHTMGPMVAAVQFRGLCQHHLQTHNQGNPNSNPNSNYRISCTLKGSLAFTGKGHSTDTAIILGLHGYKPKQLATLDLNELLKTLGRKKNLTDFDETPTDSQLQFNAQKGIIFDTHKPLPQHPNGMIFNLFCNDKIIFSETFFSIGGGFITTLSNINKLTAPLKIMPNIQYPYPFDNASNMLAMSVKSKLPIAQMKFINELQHHDEPLLNTGLDEVWHNMQHCIKQGLTTQGILPGGLNIKRRAQHLHKQLIEQPHSANINDWLCAYAMAVNEENAAGHMVVTAPTNGAAGVIPAVLYYFLHHQQGTQKDVHTFLLTAAAIGGIIKFNSSISGAEAGCQGEVGSAAAMAAAGLCAVMGGSTEQIENAAEIALEHHLGLTCDPVNGLVQVPCIERNGFGAIKAYTAASLALRGNGEHFMPLDNCIEAMRQTGEEMSHKFKETSLGGLAVCITEC